MILKDALFFMRYAEVGEQTLSTQKKSPISGIEKTLS